MNSFDNPSEAVRAAERFAYDAHKSQVDKNDSPYFLHVEAVALALQPLGDDDLVIAGYLHDVVEDTDYTLEQVRDALNLSERVVAILRAVSRNLHPELSYLDGIRAIAESEDAALVKIADNAHNSRADRRASLDPEAAHFLGKRYERARTILYPAVPPDKVRLVLAQVNPDLLDQVN